LTQATVFSVAGLLALIPGHRAARLHAGPLLREE